LLLLFVPFEKSPPNGSVEDDDPEDPIEKPLFPDGAVVVLEIVANPEDDPLLLPNPEFVVDENPIGVDDTEGPVVNGELFPNKEALFEPNPWPVVGAVVLNNAVLVIGVDIPELDDVGPN